MQHLELRSSLAELHFHLTGKVDSGRLDALEFELPPNSVVRSLQSRSDNLLRSDTIVGPDGGRRLRLIFDRPLNSPVSIDGTLVLLNAEPLGPMPLPRFRLATSNWVEWRYDRNWWGVSAPADFRLETNSLDPESVNTISSDAYLQAWSKMIDPRHTDTVVAPQMQSTFELREGTIPTFTLVPLLPRRNVTQWRQTGSIGKRRLDWTLVADVETTQAPTFQTSLIVDRRLRIERISVVEAGAERFLRWTETRTDPSRVVIFLVDKTQGKQTITLRASMPLQSGTTTSLPFVRPEDSDISSGTARLSLTRDPDVDVSLTIPREWTPDIDGANASGIDRDGRVSQGQFRLSDLAARGTIQTSSRHSRCSTRSAALLQRTEGATWQLTYRMEMTPQGDSPVRIGLNFPASFTDLNRVTVFNAESAWREPRDGVRPLDLLLNRTSDSETVIVQFEAILTEPKQADWTLLLPVPTHSLGHETILAFAPNNDWFPARGSEMRVADLPDWAANLFDDLPGSDSAFRVAGDPIQIRREVATSASQKPSVRLLDQKIRLHTNGVRTGLSHVFLSSVRNDIDFELPPRVTVTSLFLDDHPLALVAPSDGRLTVPMTDAATESLLTIAWVFEPGDSGFQFTGTERGLWPQSLQVDRNLMTLLPDEPMAVWCRSGLTKIDSLDQGLDRLETLLDRHASLSTETRGSAANRWWIDRLYTQLKQQLSKEVRNPSVSLKQQLNRWDQMIEVINRLERVSDSPPAGWQTLLIEHPTPETPTVVFGRKDALDSVRYLQIDRRFVHAGYSVLFALFLIPVLRWLIRIEWSEWLDRQVLVSWLILAFVWWLFLTPSALGPILSLAGFARAATHRKSR